jgi:hypothetical protein
MSERVSPKAFGGKPCHKFCESRALGENKSCRVSSRDYLWTCFAFHIFVHKAPDPEGKFKLPMQRSKLSGMQ